MKRNTQHYLAVAALIVCASALAEEPQVFDMHGTVQELGIKNAVDGTNIFVFRIFDKNKMVWNSEPMTVEVVNGEFTVSLGDPNRCGPPITMVMLRHLEFTMGIECGPTVEQLMEFGTPRQLGTVFLSNSERESPNGANPRDPKSARIISQSRPEISSSTDSTNPSAPIQMNLALNENSPTRKFSALSRSSPGPLTVLSVLQVGTNASVPHYSYASVPTIFKAVASGGTPPYSYEWDTDGNGSFDSGVIGPTSNVNLEYSRTFTNTVDQNLTATVRITDSAIPPATVSATYKLRVFALANTTETTKADKAIDDAMWFMHKALVRNIYNGQPTAYLGTNYYVPTTGIAVQTFQNKGHRVYGSTTNPYIADVQQMHNYLFSNLSSVAINVQPKGDPDTNHNGIGIYSGTNSQIYETGIVLVGIGTSGTQTTLVPSGLPFAGRTYQSICQDMVDYFAWGQMDPSAGRGEGSWRYIPNNNSDLLDGSQNHFVGTGLLWAERLMGCTIPSFVKDGLKITITNSQNANGGIQYYDYDIWKNVGKTGGNLSTLTLIGDNTFSAPRIASAGTFIADNWDRNSGELQSPYNIGHAYGMYGVTKGARSCSPPITEFTKTDGTKINWYNVYRTYLLAHQNLDGSFGGNMDTNWMDADAHMRTAIDTEILQQTNFIEPPVAIATADATDAPPSSVVNLHHNDSYPIDPTHPIVEYAWDVDGNGTFSGVAPDVTTSNPNAVVPLSLGPNGTVHHPVLRVTDDIGQTATDTITITSSLVNHAPVAKAIPFGQSAATANYILDLTTSSVTLDASTSYDPDAGDSIVLYEWDIDGDGNYSTPASPDLTGATPILTAAAKPAAWVTGGTYNIGLRVTDHNGPLSGFDNASVLVLTNSSPVPNNQTVSATEDTAKTITLSVTNYRTSLTVKITAIPAPDKGILYQTSNGTTLGSAIAAGDTVTNSSLKVIFVPAPNVNGTALTTFSFNAFDGVKNSVTDGVATLNVAPVNDNPVAVNESISVARNSPPTAVHVLANDTDVDNVLPTAANAGLTVTTVTQGGHGTVVIISAGADVTYQPTLNFSGSDNFTYTISDGNGGVATGTVSVTVNSPPVANAGGPVGGYVVNEGGSISLDGTGSTDADLDALTYEWDYDYDGVSFQVDATTSTPVFSAASIDGPASRTIGLRVSDPYGGSSIATVNMTIKNAPPTVTAINVQNAPPILYGDTVTVSGTFTDPVGAVDAPFTYAFSVTRNSNNSVVSMISGATGTAASYGVIPNATFFADKYDTFTVRLDVTDKNGGTQFLTISVGIQQKPITITMNPLSTQVYGTPALAAYVASWNNTFVTPSGLALSDTIGSLGAMTFTKNPALSSPVILTPIGVYSITPAGLSNSNYSYTYVPADFMIMRAGRPRRSLGGN